MRQIIKLTVVGLVAFAMAYSIGHYIRKNRRPLEPEIVKPPEAANLPEALVVYCFQPEKQTAQSKKIESMTHKLLEELFAKELKSGQIVWRVVNYEKPENARFVRDYDIKTSCIVLVDGRKGRWGDWKGFDPRTWDLVKKDEGKYLEFMEQQIRDSLNK